ncbi:MAG: 16S rRNA (cytosine(967)-C(5))-methyltransferase RsmB [Wujia sp.]
MDARDVTLSILMDMETGGTFSSMAIAKALRQNQFSDKAERAFVTRLAEGTTEYRITIDYVVDRFSKTAIRKCKPLIRCILRMSTYQILYMDSVPDSAACNEAVKLAKRHGFASLSGFVNGVLRNIARNKDNIEYPSETEDMEAYLSVRYSTPVWLVKKMMKDYQGQAEDILRGTFAERDTTIRVNLCRTTKAELKKMLIDAGIHVQDGVYDENALRIHGYDFIRRIPGYREGFFTVQDESSMCAVRAAGIKPGDMVIDVCAAPGGKTTAAAEYLGNQGVIYAMDISSDKLDLIEENVSRLGFDNVKICEHDATEPLDLDSLTGEKDAAADVVIADLPCSGLGIMGRKNDIKYRLDEEQLRQLSELQRNILGVAQGYVRSGGTLLYSTCTINPDENQYNTEWFLKTYRDYVLAEEKLFVQGIDQCDGFYYAVLRRK